MIGLRQSWMLYPVLLPIVLSRTLPALFCQFWGTNIMLLVVKQSLARDYVVVSYQLLKEFRELK